MLPVNIHGPRQNVPHGAWESETTGGFVHAWDVSCGLVWSYLTRPECKMMQTRHDVLGFLFRVDELCQNIKIRFDMINKLGLILWLV